MRLSQAGTVMGEKNPRGEYRGGIDSFKFVDYI